MSETMDNGQSVRVAVVTGGSRGLGAGLVQALLDDGLRVATCARTRTPTVSAWEQETDTADRFLFRPAHLADPADCKAFIAAAIEQWGRIDVLVNNVGVAREGVLGMFTDDDLHTVIDLNLKGTLFVTRLVSRRMMARRSGSIINISSVVGLSGYRGLSVYSATKAALDGLTRSLARELGSRGIRVNSIAPGYMTTELSRELSSDQLEQIVRRTPLGRLGTPDDVTRVVRLLADPGNTFITGQVIVVDGGLTC